MESGTRYFVKKVSVSILFPNMPVSADVGGLLSIITALSRVKPAAASPFQKEAVNAVPWSISVSSRNESADSDTSSSVLPLLISPMILRASSSPAGETDAQAVKNSRTAIDARMTAVIFFLIFFFFMFRLYREKQILSNLKFRCPHDPVWIFSPLESRLSVMTRNHNVSTLKRLLIIAGPMIISQASDTIMLFVDRLFLSRLGGEYLAASMSGGLSQFMVSSFFVGTIGYVTAVVAQYFGAGRREKCAEAVFQAVLLSIISYPVILAASPLMKLFFSAVGQSPLQVELAYTYFHALIFGVVFVVLRNALAGFFIGIGRTTMVMIANFAGMLVNLPVNYLLIYGKFGFPALGLRGAAIGTICGNAVIFLILAGFYFSRRNREEFSTHKTLVFRPAILRTLLKYGIPAGIEMLLNVAAFNLFVQLMHTYGTGVAAAVTVAFNWDVVAFLPMLGMGHAVTSLVGQNVGAGDLDEAKNSTYTGLKTAWLYSFVMVIVFVVFARPLVGLFIPGDGGEITLLAVQMLRLASIYILADSAQIVFVGALRGAGDTRWVMAASTALHWGFTAVALIMIKVLKVNPVAAWTGMIVFVVTLGITMFLRFKSGRWTDKAIVGGDSAGYHNSTSSCPEMCTEESVEND